jgi:hypothetical protein
MQLLMMRAAQRDGELVADLAAQGSRLREFQMVGIARGLLADEAGLVTDKQQVGLAALAGKLLGTGQSRLGLRWQRRLQRGLGARSRCRQRLFAQSWLAI